MDRNLKIIYEDEDLLVCDKKAGIPVQSAKVGIRDLETLVRNYLIRKSGRRDVYVAVVHRLDQPVEGLVLFAKNRGAAAHLSEQIKHHTAEKYYLAVVEGVFEKEKGQLTNYLKKDIKNNTSQVVDKSDRDGKESKLNYRILESGEDCQLVEIHLLTGRHHQIRVQFSYAGHPIIGDTKYNSKYQSTRERIFPALCAYKLVITHPVTGKLLEFHKEPEGKLFDKFMNRQSG